MAGACNAVLGRKFLRSEDSPLSHLEIAALLHGMLSEQAAKRHASVARLLGVSSLEPAFDALRADLAAEGRSLGGRKELGCKPKEAFTRLRLICEERVRSREEEDARTHCRRTTRKTRDRFTRRWHGAAAKGKQRLIRRQFQRKEMTLHEAR